MLDIRCRMLEYKFLKFWCYLVFFLWLVSIPILPFPVTGRRHVSGVAHHRVDGGIFYMHAVADQETLSPETVVGKASSAFPFIFR